VGGGSPMEPPLARAGPARPHMPALQDEQGPLQPRSAVPKVSTPLARLPPELRNCRCSPPYHIIIPSQV
jgi:hypothetical protein